MATKLPWQLRLKHNALDLMADAMGRPEHIFGKDGKPYQMILLGADENEATASNLLGGRHKPSAEAVATIAKRYAGYAGVSEGEAVEAMFVFVPSPHARCEVAA
jgi:hypothetical protein